MLNLAFMVFLRSAIFVLRTTRELTASFMQMCNLSNTATLKVDFPNKNNFYKSVALHEVHPLYVG